MSIKNLKALVSSFFSDDITFISLVVINYYSLQDHENFWITIEPVKAYLEPTKKKITRILKCNNCKI